MLRMPTRELALFCILGSQPRGDWLRFAPSVASALDPPPPELALFRTLARRSLSTPRTHRRPGGPGALPAGNGPVPAFTGMTVTPAKAPRRENWLCLLRTLSRVSISHNFFSRKHLMLRMPAWELALFRISQPRRGERKGQARGRLFGLGADHCLFCVLGTGEIGFVSHVRPVLAPGSLPRKGASFWPRVIRYPLFTFQL
jgi:hypothetical protein